MNDRIDLVESLKSALSMLWCGCNHDAKDEYVDEAIVHIQSLRILVAAMGCANGKRKYARRKQVFLPTGVYLNNNSIRTAH